ncbi:MAG: RNA-binding S4 domain-containing protein [Acidaminococcaceae bacterium]
MEKIKILIKTDYITFANLMKFAGILQTGGQAFNLIEERLVSLNGNIVVEKRKKIRPGDHVIIKGQYEIEVEMEA